MDSTELTHISACQKGNLEEFDLLYTRHVEAIYKYLYRRTLLRATAEDLTSTTFLKALESIRSFNPRKGEFRTWLYRIARNTLIDHYRNPALKTVDIESVWDLPSEEITSLHLEQSMNADALRKALSTLTNAQREVVMLRIWEGLSYKEISDLTGKSEANCKMIFSRSVSGLRSELSTLLLLIFFPFFL